MNYKMDRTMEIYEFPEGIILPQKEEKGAPMWGLGGVCDKAGQFIQASFYDGGWAKHGGNYEWNEEQFIDVPVVYIGMFYSHWGHFLIDLTNRFWALKQLREKVPNLKIAYLGEERASGNNLEFFKLLGFSEDDLYQVNVPTRFSKVYVPEQAFKSCEWYTIEHVKMFDYVVEQVFNNNYDFSRLENLKKIYFTRRAFGKATDSEFGEEYFERYFLSNGFEAVAPEKLTLAEQIYLWNRAEEIICMNGSIPLNIVFCKNQNLKLTILNKTSIAHENPLILLEMRGVQAVFLNVYEEPYKRYPKSLGSGPFLLMPTKEFYEYCEEKGYQSPMNSSEECELLKQEKRKYYKYVFDIKRRMKTLAIKIVYQYLKLR